MIQEWVPQRAALADLRRGREEMHFALLVESFHALCSCGSRTGRVIMSDPLLPVHGLCAICSAHIGLQAVQIQDLERVLLQGLSQIRGLRDDQEGFWDRQNGPSIEESPSPEGR